MRYETETEEQEWPVRPYSKSRLATAYAPDVTLSAALNRLSTWIRTNRELSARLETTGYRTRQKVFTSLQVELIFHYLGRP